MGDNKYKYMLASLFYSKLFCKDSHSYISYKLTFSYLLILSVFCMRAPLQILPSNKNSLLYLRLKNKRGKGKI